MPASVKQFDKLLRSENVFDFQEMFVSLFSIKSGILNIMVVYYEGEWQRTLKYTIRVTAGNCKKS